MVALGSSTAYYILLIISAFQLSIVISQENPDESGSKEELNSVGPGRPQRTLSGTTVSGQVEATSTAATNFQNKSAVIKDTVDNDGSKRSSQTTQFYVPNDKRTQGDGSGEGEVDSKMGKNITGSEEHVTSPHRDSATNTGHTVGSIVVRDTSTGLSERYDEGSGGIKDGDTTTVSATMFLSTLSAVVDSDSSFSTIQTTTTKPMKTTPIKVKTTSGIPVSESSEEVDGSGESDIIISDVPTTSPTPTTLTSEADYSRSTALPITEPLTTYSTTHHKTDMSDQYTPTPMYSKEGSGSLEETEQPTQSSTTRRKITDSLTGASTTIKDVTMTSTGRISSILTTEEGSGEVEVSVSSKISSLSSTRGISSALPTERLGHTDGSVFSDATTASSTVKISSTLLTQEGSGDIDVTIPTKVTTVTSTEKMISTQVTEEGSGNIDTSAVPEEFGSGLDETSTTMVPPHTTQIQEFLTEEATILWDLVTVNDTFVTTTESAITSTLPDELIEVTTAEKIPLSKPSTVNVVVTTESEGSGEGSGELLLTTEELVKTTRVPTTAAAMITTGYEGSGELQTTTTESVQPSSKKHTSGYSTSAPVVVITEEGPEGSGEIGNATTTFKYVVTSSQSSLRPNDTTGIEEGSGEITMSTAKHPGTTSSLMTEVPFFTTKAPDFTTLEEEITTESSGEGSGEGLIPYSTTVREVRRTTEEYVTTSVYENITEEGSGEIDFETSSLKPSINASTTQTTFSSSTSSQPEITTGATTEAEAVVTQAQTAQQISTTNQSTLKQTTTQITTQPTTTAIITEEVTTKVTTAQSEPTTTRHTTVLETTQSPTTIKQTTAVETTQAEVTRAVTTQAETTSQPTTTASITAILTTQHPTITPATSIETNAKLTTQMATTSQPATVRTTSAVTAKEPTITSQKIVTMGPGERVRGKFKITGGAEWDNEYGDKNSNKFKNLGKQVEQALEEIFEKGPLGKEVEKFEDFDFSQGSIDVGYTIVFKPGYKPSLSEVEEAFAEGLGNSTSFGNFTIDPSSISFVVIEDAVTTAPPGSTTVLFHEVMQYPIPHWAIGVIIAAGIIVIFLFLLCIVLCCSKTAKDYKVQKDSPAGSELSSSADSTLKPRMEEMYMTSSFMPRHYSGAVNEKEPPKVVEEMVYHVDETRANGGPVVVDASGVRPDLVDGPGVHRNGRANGITHSAGKRRSRRREENGVPMVTVGSATIIKQGEGANETRTYYNPRTDTWITRM